MCVCVHCPIRLTLFPMYYPTLLGNVCQVRLVPASMSCTVCLCRRSKPVARPGLTPVLPALTCTSYIPTYSPYISVVPEGGSLAVATLDGAVVLWDAPTLTQLGSIEGRQDL